MATGDGPEKPIEEAQGGASDATLLEQKFEALLAPFEAFVRSQTVASGFLLVSTVAAVAFANSPWREVYETLGDIHIAVSVGSYAFDEPVHLWVNEGLMALFFFLIGLEIKRELLVGELRKPSRSMMVLLAAAGGMVVPGIVYAVLNPSGPATQGWAIPVATDTAFAMGAIALLGSRAPKGLFAFLAALAIVDDIGAVVVIAVFYTADLSMTSLAVAGAAFAGMIALNALGVRRALPYVAVGIVLWSGVLGAGVHGTIAGVLAAAAVPTRPRVGGSLFVDYMRGLLDRFEARHSGDEPVLGDEEGHDILEKSRKAARLAAAPLDRWEGSLEPPVGILIVPLFAFLNAGVTFSSESIAAALASPVTLGVSAGLILGKLVGVAGGSWLAVRLGLGELPGSLTLRHVVGAGLIAGMGFTMSIFIATLAFPDNPALLADAKTGILFASLAAGVLGTLWLWLTADTRDGDG